MPHMQQKLLWLIHHQSGVFSGGSLQEKNLTRATLATKTSVTKTSQSAKFRPYQICRLGRQQLLSRNTAQTHITHTLFTSVHITGQNTTENTCCCGRLVEKAPQNMCSLLYLPWYNGRNASFPPSLKFDS